MIHRTLRISPADLGGTMAHRAGSGSGNPLKLIGGDHHHGNATVPPGPTEISGEISRQCQVRVIRQSIGALQHHMTPWAFLGVEPEVTAAGLAKADPVVLAVVAPNLNRQPPRRQNLQGARLILSTPLSTCRMASVGLQQFLEFIT